MGRRISVGKSNRTPFPSMRSAKTERAYGEMHDSLLEEKNSKPNIYNKAKEINRMAKEIYTPGINHLLIPENSYKKLLKRIRVNKEGTLSKKGSLDPYMEELLMSSESVSFSDEKISFLKDYYSSIKKVNKVYIDIKCNYEVKEFEIIVSTINEQYDIELMDKLFEIEEKISKKYSEISFSFDYIPGKYVDLEEIIDDAFLIYER